MAHLQSRIIAQDSTADRFAFFHSRLSILMWHMCFPPSSSLIEQSRNV